MKKVIIYIDGENFLHRAEESLKVKRLIKKKEEIVSFKLRNLFENIFNDYKDVEIRYYGTKIRLRDIDDKNVLKHAQAMVESQRRLKRNLVNQNVKFIVAGSLRVRETICYKCKKPSLVFKEKGVDVRMAVDIVMESGNNIVQAVVSSDSDLLPALNLARKKSRLIYVHHAERPNFAMIKSTQETRVFTANQLANAYKKVSK